MRSVSDLRWDLAFRARKKISNRRAGLGRQRFCCSDRDRRVDQPERPPQVTIVRGDQLLGGVEQVVDPRQRRAGATWVWVPADAAGKLDPRRCAGGQRRCRERRAETHHQVGGDADQRASNWTDPRQPRRDCGRKFIAVEHGRHRAARDQCAIVGVEPSVSSGTHRQEEALHRLARGKAIGSAETEARLLEELAQVMRDASICGLGQTASGAVLTAMKKFGLFQNGGKA